MDPWIIAAAISTPVVIVIIILVVKVPWLRHITEGCFDWITYHIIDPFYRYLFLPLQKNAEERKERQREEELAELRWKELEEALKRGSHHTPK